MCAGCWNPDPTPSPSRVKFLGGKGGGGGEYWFKGNEQLGLRAHCCRGMTIRWVLTPAGPLVSHKWEEEAEGQPGIDGGWGSEACLCRGCHIHKRHCSGNDNRPLRPWEGLEWKTEQARSSSSPLSRYHCHLEAGRCAESAMAVTTKKTHQ